MQPLITIALTKGRILKETLPLLEAAGIVPTEDITKSRRLKFETNVSNVRLLVLRGVDALTYIQHGVADIGVVGKDMLLEEDDSNLYELLDLKIAKCKLMTAGIAGNQVERNKRLRIATKYVNVARAHYASLGIQTDIIKLYGGMELAPLMDLADEIVDIVDTGKTLIANGLEQRQFIADISSRLVVNRASMKVKHSALTRISQSMNSVIT